MGLLDWFRRAQRVRVLNDCVWIADAAKQRGMVAQIRERLNAGWTVLLLAHFGERITKLRSLAHGEFQSSDPILVLNVDALDPRHLPQHRFDPAKPVFLLVAERHPLRVHDAKVIDFARSLTVRSEIVHHLALDDPLLRDYANEAMRGILRRLSARAGESVSTPMVGREVHAAQRRVEGIAFADRPASSIQDWFRVNCPELQRS